MIIDESDYLAHIGILHRSGRYPWGSGGPEYASNKGFLGMVEGMKKQGMSDVDIAKGLGIKTTQLRAAKSIAKNEEKQANINQAQRLHEKGLSNVAIGERMGIRESSVRALLAPGAADKSDVLRATTSALKQKVEEKQYLDIGAGTENHIGISNTKLKVAVAALQEEGYKVHYVKVQQLGTGKETTLKVLTKPDVPYSDVFKNRDQIKQFTDFSEDGGRTFFGIQTPLSIDSRRVGVRYKEEGGAEADGVIYVRPGVKDVSMGDARYAQVRIAVDGTHYLKGMAVYKDDLPKGVDLLFNTNKSNTGNKLDAMKAMKDDPDNPFGAVIRQRLEKDEHGKDRVTSALNIVGSKEGSGEEGGWDTWSKSLSTQFLSKQSPSLAKQQLDETYTSRKAGLDEIKALTNPGVRKALLESYADDVDSSAVHLKAAALPRQSTHVIIPINSLKDNEIYAPNFKPGERVVLVRYPHGGKFEIPELTVNNQNPEGRSTLGHDAKDAVGINHRVAERLSGADFDGDTVLVIPNGSGKIKSEAALEGLKNFDPKSAYPPYHGMRTIDGGVYDSATKSVDYGGKLPSPRGKGMQMGLVSNLITDMTIRGASKNELAAAVRHSMVVIDAEKHHLDYKASSINNGIPALMKKYQGRSQGGSSTLISKATSPVRVAKRAPRSAAEGGSIDKTTGKKMYTPTGESWVNAQGKVVFKTEKSTKLAETDDAHSLSSHTPIEKIYADHSNRLKALANEARLEMVNTKTVPYSPSAKLAYAKEVQSLNAKLQVAFYNRPIERQAQIVANSTVAKKKEANPDMELAELKKIKSQALTEARTRLGAKKQRIDITENEWAAIQAGAISNNRLSDILRNTDIDHIKKLATPRTAPAMTNAKQAQAKAMINNGHTQAEVAAALGVSVTTLKTSLAAE